jgi:hypothetical protein
LLFSARIAQGGRLRDYLLAGAFAGFATATKWPAATIFIAVIGGFIYARLEGRGPGRRPVIHLAAAAVASLVAIFIASPFIFLDWRTVLANVSGEVASGHLGHTGGTMIDNLLYYLGQPIAGSMGMVGLLLVLGGGVASAIRSPVTRWTMIPAAVLFLLLICSQHLIWPRWILPVMPMICIFAAFAIDTLGEKIGGWFGRPRRKLAIHILALLVGAPSLMAAVAQARERANDTRAEAARWAVAHVPAGSTIIFEHLELSVRNQPWHILFPVGAAGCIDGVNALRKGVGFEKVQRLRKGSPIVDLGNVGPDRIESCRSDFAVLAYYDLYLKESGRYPAELKTYQRLLAGGRTVALFRPQPGEVGGPVVRIVALPPHQL